MNSTVLNVGCLELSNSVSQYKWTIHNFSSFNEPTGKYIGQEIFTADNTRMVICLFPNGYDEASKEFVSISLLFSHPTIQDCEITGISPTKVYKTCKVSSQSNFIKEFVHRDILLADFKENNDVLTIDIEVVYSNIPIEKCFLNFIRDISSLSKSKENTDVTLVSSDKSEYKAHKVILACRSKVFAAMFQHNMKESQDNIVNIEDVDSKTLGAMLDFIYKGFVYSQIKMDDDAKKLLLIAADKYELNNLRRMFINSIKIDIYNVLDLIKFADTYSISEMKLKTKEYFVQNSKEIFSNKSREDLKDLPRNVIEDLLYDLGSSTISASQSSSPIRLRTRRNLNRFQ